MDISRVCKDEDLRQELIKIQKGNGIYNHHTGVYKWGEVVYDLTKTNGEIGLGWIPMRSLIFKYNFGGEKMTESEYFKSNKFKEDFRKKVEEDTWEKQLK